MSKKILQQLFDGEIYPAENIVNHDPEYHKVRRLLTEEKERFLKVLSDNDRECFKKIDDLYFEVSGMYSYACFAHGFRLGVALVTEALNGTDGLARNDNE